MLLNDMRDKLDTCQDRFIAPKTEEQRTQVDLQLQKSPDTLFDRELLDFDQPALTQGV